MTLGDDVLFDQRGVALKVLLGLDVGRVGLSHLRLRLLKLPLRTLDPVIGCRHGCAVLRDRTIGLDGRYGDVHLARLVIRFSRFKVGFVILNGRLEVAGIDFDQHVTLLHELILIEVDLDDLSRDART